MTEQTAAIVARFSVAEWARSKELGFPIPVDVVQVIQKARKPERWRNGRKRLNTRAA